MCEDLCVCVEGTANGLSLQTLLHETRLCMNSILISNAVVFTTLCRWVGADMCSAGVQT